jgi:CO/xanthine dehydrogenase Mo-binding subunit
MNSIVGTSVPRKDGRDKVSGRAMYVDDMQFSDVIYGATVRSPIARGRLVAVHFGSGIPWDEFTIVRAADIPGKNCIALITDDQPCLVDTVVNHPEEPVLLLGHADRYLLEEARRAVQVEVEPWPAVFSVEESIAGLEVIWGENNIFKQFVIEKGNVDAVWDVADFIVDGEYSTGAQEQLYIETNGMAAVASPRAGVTVWGSMQCPYYVHHALTKLFGLSDDRVRVVQMETGGGFGGKEEYPSMIAAHAALLAWKSGKQVKLIYDRDEDMVATTKRHPAKVRHRTALRRDGKLLAMQIHFIIDGGAYATLSPVVLSRGGIHATGPYYCPNIQIHCKAVATNTPPHGAFRGFGAPQTLFALECHMNKVAAAVRLPPEEFRHRNFLRQGQDTATGQIIREDVNMSRLLERALAESDYYNKQAQFARENARGPVKKGIGFAAFCHGAGFTGSGERYLASIAGVEATPEGRVRILSSGVEMGQGSNTSLAQIVAETLMLPVDWVDVAQPDTARVPNSGPTVASRTCMVIGKLLERAASGLKKTLQAAGMLRTGYSGSEFRAGCKAYIEQYGTLKAYAQYETPPGIEWDEAQHKGDAYGTFAWAVYVAEVSVDSLTFEVQVRNFVAVQDGGGIIHPLLAAGQIEGGVIQGIGYALYENVVWTRGRMENAQMTNYIIPTSMDAPPIRVIFEENPYPYGPMGAKGIGELPIDGPAPAVVNAIENAIGVSVTTIPVIPEVLLQAVERARA